MRYEDASQTGAAGSDVNARDDADHLAANDFGPASGNLITGSGTITGATGTDSSGHIVAITGAGGSDDSIADGKLEVAGQYGTLTIDADGNYSYARNPGSPEGVSDVFTYTLANDAGATDTAKLTINIGDLPILQAEGSQTVRTADGVIVLPPGVQLSDVRVVGRDLVITLPDGSTMVIPDGAVFVPQLVLDGVAVPASNLAALLIDSEPRPAAGDFTAATQSSGGNFGLPPGPLDPGVPLGDLIPPTELFYNPPEFDEIFDAIEENDPPTIGVSEVNVSEEGVSAIALPNPDTSGSPDTTNSPTNGGTVPVFDTDGDSLSVILGTPPSGLTSQGTLIVWSVSPDGHTLTGSAGGNTVLTLVINDAGVYTVTLLRPVDHPTAGGEQGTTFVVPVSVDDGENPVVTGGTITVTIEDDSPTITGRIGEPLLVVDDTTLGVNDTESFAGVVDVSYGADGPAAANPLSYALGTPGGASGIIDVATGEAVNLSLVGGVIEGRTATSNLLVFTVSVDGSGNVTLDQIRAVQHNDPADPIETGASAATLSSDNLVTLSIVATDRDGDQASISVNIGQNLRFEDDGPSISTNSASEPILVVDDTTLGSDASASFAGLFTAVFGNDGPAAGGGISYALSVIAGPSGIIDVATGEAVNLVMNGAVVEGRSATTNQLVFTISVNGSGVVTLDQIRAVQHNDPADPDEPGASAATLSADNLVKLTATVTDKDGDSATASVNIGQNLQFKDDGPSVSVTSATEPVLVVDDTTLGTNASASFAGLFAPVFGNDGPAAGGGISYGLSIIAGASGIIDVATGQAVNLVMNGSVVEGRTAGSNDLVFTISVDSSGVVTLDQIRAVQHNDPADPDEPGASAATLSADNLVKLTATVTDKDGDTATASVDIGQNMQFKDDGPSASVTSATEPVLVVDDTTLGSNASASFAGLFSAVFGNDGPAAGGGITYGLSITAGASGIIDVATGEAVNLVMNGSVVEGRTATTNQLVFTVSVDSAGVVTLDQIRAVQHNDPADHDEPGASAATLSADNLVKLTATVTDKDGDTATASVDIGQNLQFKDDGPSASVNGSATEPVLVVDDTTLGTNASGAFAGLFSTAFGNDGPASGGGLTYGLSITAGASGIIDVATGEAVNLVMNGAVVEGRTATTNQLVFTISVDSGGVVTLDQIRAVQHNDPADPDEPGASAATLSADNLVRLTVTATDKDGDTATASVDIGQNMQFKDDGPSAGASGTEPIMVVDDTTLGTNASGAFAGLFSGAFGNDGPAAGGGITYALSVIAGPSGLIDVATGQPIVLLMNGNIVEGHVTNGAGPLAFTVTVDAGGVVTLDQIRAVQHNDPADHDEPGASAATLTADNLIKLTATLTDKDGDTATASVDIGQNLQFKDDGPSVTTSGSEPTLVVDDTTLGTNASASFAGLFIPNYGNDGQAAVNPITYALSVTAGPSGIIDVATGEAVNLVMNGSVVEGRTATTNLLVFTVSVDSAGLVTLDQIRAVQHNDPADPDEPGASAATLTADNLIKLTATVTDRDGDTATASVDIGRNLQFKDDGPSVITSGTEPQLTVDDTTLGTNASASFAGLFIPTFGADGPAAGGGITYALSVVAGASGIIDVATGEAVNLVMNGAVVEGRSATTNQLVFTVSVDSSGVVTLDQIRAVQHNDPADPVESGASAAGLTLDTLVKLTATVTDKDGDSATATVNIGSNLHFEDDGPNAGASGTEPIMVVDDTTLGTNASGAFAGLFSGAFGNDGPAAGGGITYGLSITPGASGIIDVATGEAVNLVMNGAVVEGRSATTNQLVFTVSVDSAGLVTLDQIRAVQHNDPADPDEPGASAATLTADNLIRLTATLTDKDGDSATAIVNIGQNLQFKDDGPSVSITTATEPQLTVDDTTLGTNASGAFAGLFAPVFGNDGAGPGGGISYALSVVAGPSGIIDVATGEAVNLVMNGAVVEGRSATTNQLVFTVSVSGTGVVTLDQIRAVQHNDPADPVESGASAAGLTLDTLVKLTATVTDKDLDTATATVNIGSNLHFEDDGPSVSITTATEPVLVVDDTTLGTNASASFAGLFAPVFGADGAGPGGGITYGLSIVAGPSGIIDVATGEAVNLVMNGAVVEGRSATTNQLVFTISVSGTGVVTLDQIRAVQHNDPADPDEPGASAATMTLDNLVKLTATVTDKDLDTATAIVNIGQNMQFKDDGPSVSITTATEPVLVVDDTTLGTNASGAFAGLFAPVFGADGAGAGGGVTYALAITAGPSGIIDVATGQAVNLVMNGSVVEGRTAGSNALVFTVSVDSAGVVTLDQIRAVQHNNPADPDEPGASAATLTLDSLVRLTATVTDKDGDSATATVNIGQNLQFKDDGPALTLQDPLEIENTGPTPTGSGTLVIDVGEDVNSDFDDISVSGFTVKVNDTVIPLADITFVADANATGVPGSAPENAVDASYYFEFDYDTGTGGTATATGTLVFHKTGPEAGTYEVTLTSGPVSGFTVLGTGSASTSFDEYDLNGGAPEVIVAALDTDLFAQFTAFSRGSSPPPRLQTDDNNPSTPPAPNNAWIEGEVFTAAAGNPQASSSDAGVNGNTMDSGEVLDFDLFASDPGSDLTAVPDASAGTMFMQFFQFAGDDLIVILKLQDADDPSITTTKAIVIDAADLFTDDDAADPQLDGTPWEAMVAALGSQDALMVIEPNDYNDGNDNWVITGAQILTDDDLVTGTGLNFNGDIGASGGTDRNGDGVFADVDAPPPGPGGADFDEVQSFTDDTDVSGIKITNIGFLVPSTEDQQVTLEFDVTVTDGDGDSVTQNDVTVIIGDAPASLAATTTSSSKTVDPSIMEPLTSSLLATGTQEVERVAANSNSVTLAAAVAAAGLAASSAAAAKSTVAVQDEISVISSVSQLSTSDLGDAGMSGRFSALSALHDGGFDFGALSMASTSHNAIMASHFGELTANLSIGSGPTALLDATDMGAMMQMPAAATAMNVGMVSAESLMPQAAGVDAQMNAKIGLIVQDALQGGGSAPSIDALLSALPGGGLGDNAGLHGLATAVGDSVPIGDMGHGGVFTFDAASIITSEALALHPDAVQPVANG